MRYWRQALGRSLYNIVLAGATFALAATYFLYDARLKNLTDQEAGKTAFVLSRASALTQLPIALRSDLEALASVAQVEHATRFGAVLDDGAIRIPAFAVSDGYLALTGDVEISPSTARRWLDCSNCIVVGTETIVRLNWSVGQAIRLQSDSWRQKSGNLFWDLQIAGVFRSRDGQPANGIYLHYDYLNEGRTVGEDSVGLFLVSVASAVDAAQLSSSIDKAMGATITPTQSFPKNYTSRQFVDRLSGMRTLIAFTVSIIVFSLAIVLFNSFYWFLDSNRADIINMVTSGLSKKHVLSVYSARNLSIVLPGLILGLVVALLIDSSIFLERSNTLIKTLGIEFLPLAIAATLLFSIFPVLLFLPSLRAGKQSGAPGQ